MSMIAMMTPITRILSLILVVSLASSGGWFLPSRVLVTAESTSTTGGGEGCERLQDTLTYTQEEAPRDLSSVFPVVVEKINRVLDGVLNVEVNWSGAELHGRVGEHIIECTVTRLLSGANKNDNGKDNNNETTTTVDEHGREVTSQCFHVPFTILDTNECKLPLGHSMRHVCPPPSICTNTDGSYECSCPRLLNNNNNDDRSPWEVSFSSLDKTSCPSSPSTIGCCSSLAHSIEGKRCREKFHCPVDPCSDNHDDCAKSAKCVRAESPNNINNNNDQKDSKTSSNTELYTCECPEGLMGNGKSCRPGIDPPPQPKVMFDGVTPTALTVKNNYYCGCNKPRVDACSGFPTCQGKHEVCTVSASTGDKPVCDCKPGYFRHDKYGCVDVNPPKLKLLNDPLGDKTLRLKQGDEYREHMVNIEDENAEDYLRNLKVTYSQPLPKGCNLKVGSFQVNYTVAMPWATPPDVTVTRQVIIEDIDECSIRGSKLKNFQQNCPQLIPQCDTSAGAVCRNTDGSYTCQCPVQTTGDGFLKSTKFESDSAYPVPTSYKGGTSCVDTSKPVIVVQGPNPKIFRVSECGGLNGVMSPYSRNNQNDDEKELLSSNQRSLYEIDIKEMIRATAGAELCATYENPNVNPSDCVNAIDRTYKGDVDLSDRVTVGDPVQKSRSHWVVPYDVKDDAGNQAATVYRDVMVEEVSLAGMEKKLREEVIITEQRKMKRAIDNAVREERKKWDAENRASNNRSRKNPTDSNAKSCPACSPCVCAGTDVVNAATCSPHCKNMSANCRKLSDESQVYALLFWLEDTFPAELVPLLIFAFILIGSVYFLRWMWTSIFNPKAYTNYDYGNYGSINDEMVLATHPEARQPAPVQRTADITAYGRSPSLSTTNNHLQNGSNGGGTFFSPGSQLGSPPPRNNLNNANDGNNNPSTPVPAAGILHRDERYDGGSMYQSPPLIAPSKNGEGARRRSPYR